MFGVNRKIRHFPDVVLVTNRGHALFDGVLVRAGEGGVDKFAHVGMAHMNRQAIRVLGYVARLVDVANIEFRVNTLREQVKRQVDHVHVPGALSVSEQRSLHAVRSRQDAELGRATPVPRSL